MKGFLKMLKVKEFNMKIKRKDLYDCCSQFLTFIEKSFSNTDEKTYNLCFDFAIETLGFCKEFFFGQLFE
jgi:hypothetical protein